jgi:hypothetical protein
MGKVTGLGTGGRRGATCGARGRSPEETGFLCLLVVWALGLRRLPGCFFCVFFFLFEDDGWLSSSCFLLESLELWIERDRKSNHAEKIPLLNFKTKKLDRSEYLMKNFI